MEISYKYISGKIKEVGTNEDGEIYFVIGDCTKNQAWKAIRRYERVECGLSKEELANEENMDLEECNFWEGKSEESNGEIWKWWGNPPKDAKPIGKGWLGRI